MAKENIVDALEIAIEAYCEKYPKKSYLKEMLKSSEDRLEEGKSCLHLINIVDAVKYYLKTDLEHVDYVEKTWNDFVDQLDD